jgi:hypothetical protein
LEETLTYNIMIITTLSYSIIGVVGQPRLLDLFLSGCPDHIESVQSINPSLGKDYIGLCNKQSKSGCSWDPSPSVYFPSGHSDGSFRMHNPSLERLAFALSLMAPSFLQLQLL